ncbi:helix-turn-helix transcriptional regulator [Aestuariivirga sp.]|uniref:helix-turn-helix transcriptional regulator n=1 Tax=Aestuariivirga sp. TaxID=2650926 RepID=UPI003593BD5D
MSESGAFLQSARDRFGVLNLSYWFLGASPELPDRMTWLSTYDESYMAIYMRDYTPLKDKAFQICFQRLLPLDWDEVRSTEQSVQDIHDVAEQYGVGRHGISIPIRDPGVGDAMFSINFECEDRHWLEVRQQLVNNIHLFAHYYHLRMKGVIAARPVTAEFDLSPREREVLRWAADGKTAWETAQLIGVSERAIRLYTENAMNKLRAKTKTQAVAIAMKNAILH